MPAKAGILTLARTGSRFAGTSAESVVSDDDFLARWSRRKRTAGAEACAQPAPKPAPPKAEPEFDLATLPPIESINATDRRPAFLQQGVPAELARAALRRVWTADPAIRDFVGLAENAWDFTDPAAMPGFGPLEATDEVRAHDRAGRPPDRAGGATGRIRGNSGAAGTRRKFERFQCHDTTNRGSQSCRKARCSRRRNCPGSRQPSIAAEQY